jgi:hypothetical protein
MFSALPLRADVAQRSRHVRFVPTPEVVFLRSLRWHGRAPGRTPAIPVNPNNRRLDARCISYGPTRDLLFETCIAQAIDLYPGKSRGQRDQRDGLEPVMGWSAEQRTANCGGDEDAVLLAAQELSRCTLQLRCDPDVPAVEKGAEGVERATVQPDADRAAELLLVPNCFNSSGSNALPMQWPARPRRTSRNRNLRD